jgi:hypothetical protein
VTFTKPASSGTKFNASEVVPSSPAEMVIIMESAVVDSVVFFPLWAWLAIYQNTRCYRTWEIRGLVSPCMIGNRACGRAAAAPA